MSNNNITRMLFQNDHGLFLTITIQECHCNKLSLLVNQIGRQKRRIGNE